MDDNMNNNQNNQPTQPTQPTQPVPPTQPVQPQYNQQQYNQQQFNQQPYNQQQQFNQQTFNQQPQYNQQQFKQTNTMATVSMVMGILSLVSMCCSFGFPFSIIGIILAFVSKNSEPDHSMNGQAKAGLITSIVSIVLCILIAIGYAILAISNNWS